MSADPHPELRCRCVHRAGRTDFGFAYEGDDYYDRCHNLAIDEGGLCAHCADDEHEPYAPGVCGRAGACVRDPSNRCCRCVGERRRLLTDPATPCCDRGTTGGASCRG